MAFHNTIGPSRIESRVLSIASALKEKLQDRIEEVRFHTPLEPDLSAGVVVFAIPTVNVRELYGTLYSEHSIGCAAMGGDFTGIRLSPHIYNTMREVDRVVDAITVHL